MNDATTLRMPAAGNGAVPSHEGAPDLLAEMARLKEECETLRQLAVARAAELENLSLHKGEQFAIAAHDLRNPLTVVLGYAQVATRLLAAPTPDPDRLGHILSVIHAQGVEMTGLCDDLIDASRGQLGALDVQPARCDISASLTAVLSRLLPDERERVDVTMPLAAAAVGHCDRKRIEQVLANLIGNALKYSSADTRVSIVVTRHEEGVEVAVSDRGMGIPPNDLSRVFERFHRAANARASGRAGAGLVPYICHGIVAAHGGSLRAESPGENLGATFRFNLPDQPPSG